MRTLFKQFHAYFDKRGNVSFVGNGCVSVNIADIINSTAVQKQVAAVREIETNGKR